MVFLAAAHDIGKANRFFQAKVISQAERLGLAFGENEAEKHGYATGYFLKGWLENRWGWAPFPAANVARAVGGHHGSFFAENKAAPLELEKEPWKGIGIGLLDDVAMVLGASPQVSSPADLNTFLAWIAGFVCVADWLGSHKKMTIFQQEPIHFHVYLSRARDRARSLLTYLMWPQSATSSIREVSQLVPEGRDPNGVQRLAQRIGLEGFGLAVVEAPTGEGKTEAAFALAEPGRSMGGGVCFLLPTVATSNGLYPRVQKYLASKVKIAHSQAWLYRTEDEIIGNPGDEESPAEAEDWFAGSKRSLLALYGVGTIDSGLMGALRVRHGFVRLFALAGKTVVVDEVHAYDVYMSDLLEVLLGWLRALGCQVVLLSATLPAARRAALFRAWGIDDVEAAPYPCLTWTDSNGNVRSETFEVAPRKPLTLRLLQPEEGEAWTQGAARILELAAEFGGTGALVLNTVRGAQRAYEWLVKETKDSEIDVMIFHARYTAEDRQRKEREALAQFGKDAPRRKQTILVATQVVEQSLDLDFDHMVSALAPIDLLIQRAGRLHRHARRSDGTLCPPGDGDARPNPVLEVLPPEYDEGGIPELREPVYDRDVQMRTERCLREGIVIATPEDVALAVEAVYGDAPPEESREAWLERLVQMSEQEDRKREKMNDLAKGVLIPKAAGRVPLTDKQPVVVEDDKPGSGISAKTRLEDLPSITLAILSEGDPSPDKIPNVANKERLALKCVRVSAGGQRFAELLDLPRAKGWKQTKALREARPVVIDTEGRFHTPSYVYHYDVQTGLHWETQNGQLSP